jgi:ribonuclease HI
VIVEVFCDGSGTTGNLAGGWGYVIVVDGTVLESNSGGLPKATNNVAELTAALEGLKRVQALPQLAGADVTLVSDSQLTLGFAGGNWQCKKLHLALLANNLNKIYTTLNAKTRWVRGHTGDEHNETCDKLAKAAREKLMNEVEN